MLYEQHLRVGVTVQGFLVVFVGVGSLHTGSLTLLIPTVGMALPVTLLGAVIPDLDEPQSHVYRWFRPFAAVCAALYVFVFLYTARDSVIWRTQQHLQTATPGYLAGVATTSTAVLTCILVYRLLSRLVENLPHRGLFHQLPTGITAGVVLYPEFIALLAAIGAPSPSVIAAVFATAFVVGFVSHLGADGLLLRRQTYIGKTLDEAF